MKKILLGLFLVLVLSFSVRFWKLSSFPQSLSMDEVGIGYNAYSILKTGRDEFGLRFPLTFKNVGDYKFPVQIYLASLSIVLFGFNEFGIRFFVAFLGTLTPLVFIFLLRDFKFSWKASIFTGIWFSLLPWHIFLSRASFETVTALFLVLLGTLFFVKWNKKYKVLYLVLSILFFSLSVWTYNSTRLFVPIIFTVFLFIFKGSVKEIWGHKKKYIFPFLILLFFIIPLIYLLLTGNSVTSRASDLWIGKDGSNWISQYLNYFDPVFWFWKGVKMTPSDYPDVGLLNLIDIPVFFIGIYALSKSKSDVLKKIVLAWLFLSPLPASFTRGDASPVRFLIFLPFFDFVMASGFEKIFSLPRKNIYIPVYLFFLMLNFIYFSDLYLNNFPKFYGALWHEGYKEVSQYACDNHDKYDKIIITDKYGIEWPDTKTIPYLYVLVYCKWDPTLYLKDKSLYNIEIRQPQWIIDSKENNYLLIGSRWDFPEGFSEEKIFKKIFFSNGKAAFYFVETKHK